MAGAIKGITIQFSGDTTKLDRSIRDIENNTKKLDQELNKVNKALKFNPKSVELWRQKQELLTQKVGDTEQKLVALKKKQEEMGQAGVDKNSAEWRNLQREIIETESKLEHFNKQLKEANNYKFTALGTQFEKLGKKISGVGDQLTLKLTAPLVAGFAVSSKYASDYEENLNKLDVAFGDNADAVKKWAETSRDMFGLSKVQATEAASAFGALGKGIGLSEKDAAEMSMTLAGLSADLGSYFNVGTDEAAKALEGIFTGESEALKRFGVVMNETNLQQFAADQGLVWKNMSQAEKTTLRYRYVLEKTKDAQGDFFRTSDGTANSLKVLRASVQDLATSVGTALLPIITPIVQKITEWVNKFNKLSPQTKNLITKLGLLAAAAGPVLSIAGRITTKVGTLIKQAPKMVSGIKTLVTALASNPYLAIAVGAAAAVAGITALILSQNKITREYEKAKKAREEEITGVYAQAETAELYAQKLDELSQKENKSAADKQLIQTYVDQLNQSVEGLNLTYDAEKDKLSQTTEQIYSNIEAMKAQALQQAYQNQMQEVANELVQTEMELDETRTKKAEILSKLRTTTNQAEIDALSADLAELENKERQLTDKQNGLMQELDSYADKASGNIEKINDSMDNVAATAGAKSASIGTNLATGIATALDAAHWIVNQAATRVVNDAIATMKAQAGIASPSKVTRDLIGKNLGLGVGEGLTASLSTVEADAQKFLGSVVGAMNPGVYASIGVNGSQPLSGIERRLDTIAEASSTGPITINVTAAPGMDINQLATAIENKLVQATKRRANAWA